MARECLIKLGLEDSLQDVIRKANYNFTKMGKSTTTINGGGGSSADISGLITALANLQNEVHRLEDNVANFEFQAFFPLDTMINQTKLYNQKAFFLYNKTLGVASLSYECRLYQDQDVAVLPANTTLLPANNLVNFKPVTDDISIMTHIVNGFTKRTDPSAGEVRSDYTKLLLGPTGLSSGTTPVTATTIRTPVIIAVQNAWYRTE